MILIQSDVRLLLSFFAFLLVFNLSAQWQTVPSGTDSALYCVTFYEGSYLVGGANKTLLSSESSELEFIDAADQFEISFIPNDNSPITKIGVVNNNQLFIDFNAVWNSVADNNTVFGLRAGVGVDADSNLHILEEYQLDGYADVYVDTTVFEYWTNPDYLSFEDSYIDLGTIAWMLRSTDGGESYDLGTAFNSNFSYINSAHCSSAKNFGVIDYEGKLHFSSDSGQTFSVYQSPGWPFNFQETLPYLEEFTATGFYFNEDLVGFYAPRDNSNSSLHKVDLVYWNIYFNGHSSGLSMEPHYHGRLRLCHRRGRLGNGGFLFRSRRNLDSGKHRDGTRPLRGRFG